MDHSEAVKTGAVEKYLLGEFSPAKENEFSEHFFDCAECASELRLASLFINTTKEVLQNGLVSETRTPKRWWRMEWLPSQYAMAVALACLAFILYQNVVVFPKLRKSSSPQTLAYISLSNMGARSVGQAGIVPPVGKPFILLIDVPVHEDMSGYRCVIQTQIGNEVLTIDVSDALAQNPVPILIPASTLTRGDYVVTISGRPRDGHVPYVEIDRSPFQVM